MKKKIRPTEVISPVKELYANSDKESADIVFPQDLDVEHYMRIRRIHRVRSYNADSTKKDTKQTIILPVPTELNPQYSVQYKDHPMGIAGSTVVSADGTGDISSAIAHTGKSAAGATESLVNYFTGGNTPEEDKKISGLATTISGLSAAALGVNLVTQAGGAVSAGLAAGLGGIGEVIAGVMSNNSVAVNPQMAVLFDGVGFRSFQFSYKFIPRNSYESNELKKLIDTLKLGMYPTINPENKFLFGYPDEFEIDFSEAIDPYLFKIKRCVLKDVSVNYAGDGVPRFYDSTGAPVVVELNMTFQEVQILTQNDFTDPWDLETGSGPLDTSPSDPIGSHAMEI